jgi:hypothetical protein
MGHAGDAYDNALCESLFATLECELLDRRRFPTQAEARTAVFDFIEGWYNRTGGIPAWTICHRSAMYNGTLSSHSPKAVHRPGNRVNSTYT